MAINGTFGHVYFKPENTAGLFGDYPGGIGGDSGMIRKLLNFIGDYRKILRENSGGIMDLFKMDESLCLRFGFAT